MAELTASRSFSGTAKIVVKGKYTQGGAESEEGVLKVAAYPGQNVTLCNDFDQQGRQVYTPGSTDYAGTGTDVTTAKSPIWLLKEDPLQGSTIETEYAAGDTVPIHMCSQGEVVQVLALSGENIQKGEGLTANSAGKWVVDTTNAAVIALETTGSLSADTLLRVRVL